jgi:hypothetical protein
MRKVILSVAALAFMMGTISTSFGQEADKESVKARESMNEAKKDVVDAKQDLKVAQKDSVLEYQSLTKESEVKFKNNEKSISDLRAAITKGNSKDQLLEQKKVSDLELKNNDLKRELSEYKVEGQIKFSTFKSKFNKDLDQLTKDLKDFKTL